MSAHSGPNITTNGLILCLDAGNINSYVGDGKVWADVSGFGGSGELSTTSIQFLQSPIHFDFDGGSYYVRFIRDDLNGGSFAYQEASFEMWYKHKPGQTGQTTNNILTIERTFEISGGDKGNGYVTLQYASQPWSWRGNSGDHFKVDEWVHIIYVHEHGSRRVYTNGNLVYESTETGYLRSGTSSYPYLTLMGRYNGTGSSNDGKLSIVRIYNRALTDEEILLNLESHRSRYNI